MCNYWTSANFVELSDDVIDAIVALAGRKPTQASNLLVHQVGGVINDVAPDATAYPHRDVQFIVSPGARWEDPVDDDRCLGWIHECGDALAASATGGTYVNFVTERGGREQVAYGDNYERLVEVKSRWDPDNLFRGSQNVTPA
jgi:FAD/FMN-containing dehydrogenase